MTDMPVDHSQFMQSGYNPPNTKEKLKTGSFRQRQFSSKQTTWGKRNPQGCKNKFLPKADQAVSSVSAALALVSSIKLAAQKETELASRFGLFLHPCV